MTRDRATQVITRATSGWPHTFSYPQQRHFSASRAEPLIRKPRRIHALMNSSNVFEAAKDRHHLLIEQHHIFRVNKQGTNQIRKPCARWHNVALCQAHVNTKDSSLPQRFQIYQLAA